MERSVTIGGIGFFSRLRSLAVAVLALLYYFIVRPLASHAANGLSSGAWFALVDQALLLFLLILGYAAMALIFQRQRHPMKSLGLVVRPCWQREFGTGAALGWGMMLACVLPIALAGGLIVTLWTTPRQFGFLALNLATIAIAALVQEVVFRGYLFQRLIEALGTTFGTVFLVFIVAVFYARDTDWTTISMSIALSLAILLSLAYLRTRALWLGWGFHFAWIATMAVLFGLPLRGSMEFSSVVQSDARGPYTLTGGSYGPEGSLLALISLMGGIIVLVRATRQYAWSNAQPVIVAGGMPVDLDRAQQRQHASASIDPSLDASLHSSLDPALTPNLSPHTNLVQIAPATSMSPVLLQSNAAVPLAPSRVTAPVPASATIPEDLPTPD